MTKRTISITTKVDTGIIRTKVNLDENTIYVSKDNRFIYNGDIPGFKSVVATKKSLELRKTYEDILDLGELLIDKLSQA